MVRFTLSACTLVVLLVAPVASAAPGVAPVSAAPPAGPPPAAPTAIKSAPPTPSAKVAPAPTTAGKPADKVAAPQVQLDWRARMAIGIQALQSADPALLDRLEKLQPDRKVGEEVMFTQADLHDARAAAVVLRRLMQGTDPVKVRRALVDALPHTGGDWQEGAAALIGVDASPLVRKKLVEVMRYASPPHSVQGLRLGFKDEDPEIRIAAARTAGFSRSGPELVPELYSSTFDTDWDLRAASVQALGMLKLPQSREVLIKALYDEEREVRLQALLALEQLDPEGIVFLPEIDILARDRKSHRIARKADMLLRKRRAALKAGANPVVRATPKETSPDLLPVAPASPPASPKVQGTH